MTKVIFRVHNVKGEEPEVIAFLPELPGSPYWLTGCLCYAHLGQHSNGTFNYYYESTRPATPDEYADLLSELQGIYNGQLKPVTRMTYRDQLKRMEAVK